MRQIQNVLVAVAIIGATALATLSRSRTCGPGCCSTSCRSTSRRSTGPGGLRRWLSLAPAPEALRRSLRHVSQTC